MALWHKRGGVNNRGEAAESGGGDIVIGAAGINRTSRRSERRA